MDIIEFMQMVEGNLAWQEQKTDYELEHLAWFSANQMMSSGNLKKGTDPMKVKEGLFTTYAERRSEAIKSHEDKKVDVQAEKDRLNKIFNLEN